MRPHAIKYGPFQQIEKIIVPNWACCGNPKAIWDCILRLDYGPSPLNGKFELKTNFLGKTRTSSSAMRSALATMETSTRQVFFRNMIKRVPVGTC